MMLMIVEFMKIANTHGTGFAWLHVHKPQDHCVYTYGGSNKYNQHSLPLQKPLIPGPHQESMEHQDANTHLGASTSSTEGIRSIHIVQVVNHVC